MNFENGMINNMKIAYIGGGSRGWAWTLMNDLKKSTEISGEVYLYDIDFPAAQNNEIIGNKIDGDAWKYKAVKESRAAEKKELEDQLAIDAQGIPAELLATYQTKRKEKIFPVVGKMIGGRCPFCSMEPPLVARNKLGGGGMIVCDNCHRLIFTE